MDIIGAYLITDFWTKKFYVGSSRNVKKRFQGHIAQLQRGKHHNSELQSLWWKTKGFSLTVFPTETREDAYLLEQDIINRHLESPLMVNIGMGVSGGDNITRNKNREDIISRIKKSVIERMSITSADDRRLLYGRPGSLNPMWGKTHTEEVRRKMGQASIGNKYNLGRKKSDEERRKMSERAKLRTGELNPFFGKKHSEETRQKLSARMKELKRTPTNARKVSVDGGCYTSVRAAASALGVSPELIRHRIKSPLSKYDGYSYIC